MKSIRKLVRIVIFLFLLTKIFQVRGSSTHKENCFLSDPNRQYTLYANRYHELKRKKDIENDQNDKYMIKIDNAHDEPTIDGRIETWITISDLKSTRKLCFEHKKGKLVFKDEDFYINNNRKCQWKQDPNKNNEDLFTLTNEEYSQRYMSWTCLRDVFTKKGMYKRKRNRLSKLKKYRRRTPPIWFKCKK